MIFVPNDKFAKSNLEFSISRKYSNRPSYIVLYNIMIIIKDNDNHKNTLAIKLFHTGLYGVNLFNTSSMFNIAKS